MTRELPCGSWPSPISSELIVSGAIALGGLRVDGADTWWTEGRPEEDGRYVLVRAGADGVISDVVGAPHNVRTRVHEYGGNAYCVHDGVVWFSDFASGRLHRLDPGGAPRAITPEGDLRYADLVVDAARRRLLCVLEDHTTGAREAVNSIAAVPLEGGAPQVIAGGHDFAAAPRVSPDGRLLAWLTWDHPRLPWDGTELWVAELDGAGRLANQRPVAGGTAESIAEPTWAADGSLWFSSDARSGWWNLHRWDGERVVDVAPMERETTGPMWLLGSQHFGFLEDSRVVVATAGGGRKRLLVVDPATGAVEEAPIEYRELGSDLAVRDDHVLIVAASPTASAALVDIDLGSGEPTVLRHASTLEIDAAMLSVPEVIDFPSEGGRMAHAFHYSPTNAEVTVAADERPPLLVMSHGGPTGATSQSLRWGIQYFTSRGFAVVDVDYGGSTGYGRAYRESLYGKWGIVDVEDCVAAVRYLSERGDADPRRVCIDGGSAGGYTTLRALTSTSVFAAGCSLFGIGDLSVFTGDTHKFESRYCDQLIGPYPERADLYWERSPINHVDQLRTPVILFQGLEDRIVPPNQAELFFDAALRSGVPCAHEAFAGEQHGFRIAANIRRSLDGELAFYGAVLGFTPAETLDPPLTIRNLDSG